jgi:CO/xanthine dehydrogenase Mo-binding subunit
VQAALADAIYQITGKRFRDLPLRQHDLTWI